MHGCERGVGRKEVLVCYPWEVLVFAPLMAHWDVLMYKPWVVLVCAP